MIQLTDYMKLKKKEDQIIDASALLRRENKIIMGGRGWEGLGRNRGGGWEKGDRNRCGRKFGICTEGLEIKQRSIAIQDGELG